MNLAASLTGPLWQPRGAFEKLTLDDAQVHSSSIGATNHDEVAWSTSVLNPATRVDSIDPLPNPKWRIDGSAAYGLQFFAVPIFQFPHIVPRRIDVFIPDQREHPAALREALQSDMAFHLIDSRVARLGICHHIVRALEIWTREQTNFRDLYESLPFGSRIMVENISPSPYDMRIRIVSLDEIERQYLTVDTLQRLWNFSPGVMPPSIELSSLSLDVQAHDTVAFVRIPKIHPSDTYVFKSAVHEVRLTYHELKVLISISPHEHILPKPLFIVTMTDRHGLPDLVCGFIVKFFPGGNLAGILSSRGAAGKLILKDQLRWAQQLTRTLIFVNQSPVEFYSELKADNILLSTAKGTEDVIFIDFEQTGTWMEFSPPEVNCIRTLERLAETPEVIPEDRRTHYLDLGRTVGVDGSIEETIYTNPPRGYFKTWLMLSPMESEAAEIYSLGMTLWCIFEGVPSNRNPMRRSWPLDHLQEFPEFRHTPKRIQILILKCTRGYESWSLDILIRRGAMMYPPGKSGLSGEPVGTALETQEAGLRIWERWLDETERYLLARKRWLDGCASEDDVEMLGFPLRPQLTEVLDELDDIVREHEKTL